MARKARLKVYRTPIGFHDAYVAASSQKAALEAWGSDANLFARGSAELVTDDELTREPLADPGKVIRRLRGSAEEHIAALPKDRPKSKARPTASSGEPASARSSASKPARVEARKPPPPRPSRAALDRAEREQADLATRQGKEDEALRRREAEVRQERERLERVHARERASAERAVDRERDKHSEALAHWGAKLTDGA